MINLLHPFIGQLILTLIKIICLLVAIAYYTIAERKIMASIQRRRGPNVVGVWGLLQPLADGLKLIAKEMVIPSHSNSRIFVIAPLVILTLGLLTWSIIPFGSFDHFELNIPKINWQDPNYNAPGAPAQAVNLPVPPIPAVPPAGRFDVLIVTCVVLFISFAVSAVIRWLISKDDKKTSAPKDKSSTTDDKLPNATEQVDPAATAPKQNSLDLLSEINDISDVHYSLLLVLALSSLTVYGLIIAGWASNSKYAFLGALRSAAQIISYEVAISLIILPVVAISGSLNFVELVNIQKQINWFILPLLPINLIFFISIIAETNRTPFDLPEAEAELVAGYNVEYSSIIFAIFFLAEYGNIIIMSLLKSLLFLGGWDGAVGFLLPSTTFAGKGLVFCFLFVLVRATFPRYRYDQLIGIGWIIFLPITTGYLILDIGYLFSLDSLPVLHEVNYNDYSELTRDLFGLSYFWHKKRILLCLS